MIMIHEELEEELLIIIIIYLLLILSNYTSNSTKYDREERSLCEEVQLLTCSPMILKEAFQ